MPVYLSELADEMFSHDAPVSLVVAAKRWGLPIVKELPKGLFEAALLAKVRDNRNLPALDFYYGRERDFVVSCWVCQWYQKLLQDEETILKELSAAVNTQVGTEALRWFLAQPSYQNCLQLAASLLSSYSDFKVKRILLSSIRESISRSYSGDDNWILEAVDRGASDSNVLVKAEAAKLMAVFTADYESLASIIDVNEELEYLIINLLDIEQEDSLSGESVKKIIFDALRQMHWDLSFEDEESEVTDILNQLINHNLRLIRMNAAKAFGYMSPKIFLRELSKITKSDNFFQKIDFVEAVEVAVGELQEIYYGSLCPGYLELLQNSPADELCDEYSQMYQICKPIIDVYSSEQCGHELLHILESLHPKQIFFDKENLDDFQGISPPTDKLFLKTFNNPNHFAYAYPKEFLENLSNSIQCKKLENNCLQSSIEAIEIAVKKLKNLYFDANIIQMDISSGNLEWLCHEYRRIHKICTPIIRFYYPAEAECSEKLLSFLKDLLYLIEDFRFKWDIPENPEQPLPSIGDILVHLYQLSLPFDLGSS